MGEKKLLILDDDAMIGKTLLSIATRANIPAFYTDDPAEFFAHLEHWKPTHIALDLVMPKMDGVQVLGELAKLKCEASIIITSGQGGRVLEAAARSAAWHGLSIQAVLGKPFSTSAFRKLLSDESSPTQTVERLPSTPPHNPKDFDESDLRSAIEQRQLRLVYQPKVECRTGNVAGLEALIRWHHPQLGVIAPDRFIAIAERSGLIDDLTELVLDEALRWLAVEQERHAELGRNGAIPPITMSINISVRSLTNAVLMDAIEARCHAHHIAPERIILELTETSAMENTVLSLDVLTRLRLRGFQLSIDDFGTGYSSMVQLVRMPFSELKVDKSFVMGARYSSEYRTVINSVVKLGQSLGLKTVAEGLEDAETLKYLIDVGCDLAQGYYISKPIPGNEALEWVDGRL